MDLGLKGKVAIVTGSSRGIGRSIAMGLADEGCNLVICARGDEALQRTAREIREKGVEVVAFGVVSVPAKIDEVRAAVEIIEVVPMWQGKKGPKRL